MVYYRSEISLYLKKIIPFFLFYQLQLSIRKFLIFSGKFLKIKKGKVRLFGPNILISSFNQIGFLFFEIHGSVIIPPDVFPEV